MSVRVSAVLPNYNDARLLPEAIRSLGAQTRPFDEIVVIDDGSTDDSVAVIEALARQEPRLRLVRHPVNQGAVAALNTGLREARGDYVHFGGSDDRFHPRLVEVTAALLDAHPQAALACGEVQVQDRGTGTFLGLRPPVRPAHGSRFFTPDETAALLARIDNFIVTPATLFRRETLLAAGGFDASLGPFTDGYLVRRLALTHGFCFTPVVLAEWRVEENGYSRSLARDPDRSLALIAHVRNILRTDRAFPSWYAELFERRWRFAFARLAAVSEPVNSMVIERMLDGRGASWYPLARRLPTRLRRLALLAGLTLQFRPMSLVGVGITAVARRYRPQSAADHEVPADDRARQTADSLQGAAPRAPSRSAAQGAEPS